MPKDDQPAARGTARAHCNECGWDWGVPSMDSEPEPCPSCGSLKSTVSIPKAQRSKKQQY